MRPDFRWDAEPWGPALRCAPLEPIAAHLFTTRPLPLGAGESEAAPAWAALANAFDCKASALVRLRQVHGAEVIVRRRDAREDPGDERPAADAAISDDPALVLTVQVADCVPLLLADRRLGSVAAVHAGWRGTAAGAAVAAVKLMQTQFGTRPADLIVAIGPSIGPCCYEVGRELREAFLEAGHAHEDVEGWFDVKGERFVLDLWRANRDQLVRAGVPADAVHVAALCTTHDPARLCSYRRDGAAAGRMAAAIKAR